MENVKVNKSGEIEMVFPIHENKLLNLNVYEGLDIKALHTITYDFLSARLMEIDKVCNKRIEFMLAFGSDTHLHSESRELFRIKYKLDTNDKISKAVKKIVHIQNSILLDLHKRIYEITDKSILANIITNISDADKFLQKYFTKEADITDNSIFELHEY